VHEKKANNKTTLAKLVLYQGCAFPTSQHFAFYPSSFNLTVSFSLFLIVKADRNTLKQFLKLQDKKEEERHTCM